MDAARNYEFTLRGTTSLLMHADNVMLADVTNDWRKDPANKSVSVPGDDRSPAWTWQASVYHDGTELAMPGENIMACLRGAGAKISAKRGSFKSMSQSGLLIASDYCEFLNHGTKIAMSDIFAFKNAPFKEHIDAVEQLGFKLLVKRARVTKTSKHVRVRPEFEDWQVSGVIGVSEPAITTEILASLFEIGGRLIGLGDWRPGSPTSPGSHGMFLSEIRAVGETRRGRKAS